MPGRTDAELVEAARNGELRRLAHELHVQAETVDRRLVEIEDQLPDTYIFSGDDQDSETGLQDD